MKNWISILKNVSLAGFLLFTTSCSAAPAGMPATASPGGHQKMVTAVAFSSDDKYLSSSGLDNAIKIWNPATGELLQTIPLDRHTEALCFRPGSDTLAYADGVQIKMMDAATGKAGEEWMWNPDFKHDGGIRSVQFSPDGQDLLAGCDNAFILWHVTARPSLFADMPAHTEWTEVRSAAVPESLAVSVRFRPDGAQIATTAFAASAIQLWRRDGDKPLKTIRFPDAMCEMVDYSPSGQSLAVVTSEEAMVVDAATGKVQRHYPLK